MAAHKFNAHTLCLSDLSFNNIDKIEGLSALVNLTDLSLHNNHISKIEGLDTLKKLETLSIGNNALQSVEEVGVVALRTSDLIDPLNATTNTVIIPVFQSNHQQSVLACRRRCSTCDRLRICGV